MSAEITQQNLHLLIPGKVAQVAALITVLRSFLAVSGFARKESSVIFSGCGSEYQRLPVLR